MYKISYYTSPVKSKAHTNETIELSTFFEWVKSKWKGEIEKLRNTPPGTTQDRLKMKLPYITVSGTFAPGTRLNETLEAHSNLLQIDIDEKENKGLDVAIVKAKLQMDPFVLAAMLSPRGNGLKAIVKIDGTKHKDCYFVAEAYFLAQYGLVIDKACKDVSRPFFATYDPLIYINQDSEALTNPPPPPATAGGVATPEGVVLIIEKTKPKSKAASQATATTGHEKKLKDIEALCSQLESQNLDITNRNGYDEWLAIGFAIANGLGGDGLPYYHRISRLAHNYNETATGEQYTNCLKKPDGGRRWESLFGIAKDFGIVITTGTNSSKAVKVTGKAPKVQNGQEPEDKTKFYKVVYNINTKGDRLFKCIEIDELGYIRFLFTLGFRRYDVGGGFSFIKIHSNIIKEVQPQHVQDAFFEHLKGLPEQVEERVTRDELIRITIKKNQRLFNRDFLSMIHSDREIIFNEDSKFESFMYYQNGYVSCKPDGFTFLPYTNLKKCIWSEQIIKRNFTKLPENDKALFESYGNYAKFIYNVAGQDVDRFCSLCSLIGYQLHNYQEGKLKAVVLTDSNMSDDNEGRTGKTLFGKALKQIRNVCELNGKDFKPEEKFKYQAAQLSTQIIFLNDARTKFNLEALYVDITEGITIEKKNQAPVTLRVKYLITTNQIIKTNGGSSRDRVIEYEFANHYNDKYSPEMEFKQWFFKDWDGAEWQLFDNFMCMCTALYLEQGILEAVGVNLDKRKFISSTSKPFYEFVESGHILPETEFSLQDLCDRFQELHPEYNFNTQYPVKRFSKWLKELIRHNEEFKGLELSFLRKNDGNQIYIFQKNT